MLRVCALRGVLLRGKQLCGHHRRFAAVSAAAAARSVLASAARAAVSRRVDADLAGAGVAPAAAGEQGGEGTVGMGSVTNEGGRGTTLGLDISTRSTGVALLDVDGSVLHASAIPAAESGEWMDTAAAVSARVAELHEQHGIAHVAVEAFMKSFATGRFQTRGLFKLAQLNGVVAWECRRVTGAAPRFYPPNTVRSTFGVKAAAVAGGGSRTANERRRAIKEAVLAVVREARPEVEESLSTTRTGSWREESFDVGDAVLVAMHDLAAQWQRLALDVDEVVDAYVATSGRRGRGTQKHVADNSGAVVSLTDDRAAERREALRRAVRMCVLEAWADEDAIAMSEDQNKDLGLTDAAVRSVAARLRRDLRALSREMVLNIDAQA